MAFSAPADAQPCIPDNDAAFVCVAPDSWYRGVNAGFYQSGPAGAAGIVLVGEGCYEPERPCSLRLSPRRDFTPDGSGRCHPDRGGVPCVWTTGPGG